MELILILSAIALLAFSINIYKQRQDIGKVLPPTSPPIQGKLEMVVPYKRDKGCTFKIQFNDADIDFAEEWKQCVFEPGGVKCFDYDSEFVFYPWHVITRIESKYDDK